MGREGKQAIYFSYDNEAMRRFFSEAEGTHIVAGAEKAAETRAKLKELYERRQDAKRNVHR